MKVILKRHTRALCSHHQFMARFILLFLIICITPSLVMGGQAQTAQINLHLNNASIEEALNQIEKQSEYRFLYNKEQVNVGHRISINAKQKNIDEVLQNIFHTSDIAYSISGHQIVLNKKQAIKQQERTVRGVIADPQGEAIIGANIIEKGTTNGVISDYNGMFTLKVQPSSILLISYIGYLPQEVRVPASGDINIILKEDTKTLDEVVVVGYGTQKRATIVGSVANIDGKVLKKSASPNLVNSLAGRLPGLIINTRSSEPGAEVTEMNIRGKSTWKEGGPLIIIDGIANRDGFEKLSSQDIESISILKDASAAIYGSRAANGVILVTTKRGNNEKPVFNYNGSFSLTRPVRVTDMIRSWESATYQNEIQEYKGGKPAYTPEQITMFKDGSNPDLYPDYSVADLVLQKVAPQTQHTFSVNGGNERIKFYSSARYLYQDTYYKSNADDYSSISIRSNVDARLHDNVKLRIDIAGRKDQLNKAMTTENLFQTILAAVPTEPFYYQNGLPGSVGKHNVLEEMKGKGNVRDERTHSINTLATLTWDLPFITKGLSISMTGAFDYKNIDRKDFQDTYDYYVLNSDTGEYVNQNTSPKQGRSLTDYSANTYQYTLMGKLAYERTFGKHAINAFIAYEQYSMDNRWFNASRSNFLSNKLPYLFAGDAELQKNDGSATQTAYLNLFGRLGYVLSDRYMMDFTLRRDQSIKFAKDKRVGYFPGISLGWRISEEGFFKERFKNVDNLKIRASYGQMGSDNVTDYQYLSMAALRDGANSLAFGLDPKVVQTLYISGIANPNITWEVANTYNVGIETQLWGGLLGAEIDYFYSRRSKILTSRSTSIPSYTGMKLPDENIGEAQNQGIELLLRHNNMLGNGFRYAITGNFSYAKNKIIYMDEAKNVKDWKRKENHPIDSYLVFHTDGIFKSQEEIDAYPHLANTKPGDIKYIDFDKDGSITNDDMVREYKSSMPEIVYGMNFDFGYKGFDLSIFLQGQARATAYINPTASGIDVNVPRWLYKDRWTKENPERTMPRAFGHRSETNNTKSSDFWLRDASFLRLKNVEISYSLPTKVIRRIGLEKIRVYASGSNLLTFDKIKDYDPEVVNNLGIFYPATSMYNFGLDITF